MPARRWSAATQTARTPAAGRVRGGEPFSLFQRVTRHPRGNASTTATPATRRSDAASYSSTWVDLPPRGSVKPGGVPRAASARAIAAATAAGRRPGGACRMRPLVEERADDPRRADGGCAATPSRTTLTPPPGPTRGPFTAAAWWTRCRASSAGSPGAYSRPQSGHVVEWKEAWPQVEVGLDGEGEAGGEVGGGWEEEPRLQTAHACPSQWPPAFCAWQTCGGRAAVAQPDRWMEGVSAEGGRGGQLPSHLLVQFEPEPRTASAAARRSAGCRGRRAP